MWNHKSLVWRKQTLSACNPIVSLHLWRESKTAHIWNSPCWGFSCIFIVHDLTQYYCMSIMGLFDASQKCSQGQAPYFEDVRLQKNILKPKVEKKARGRAPSKRAWRRPSSKCNEDARLQTPPEHRKKRSSETCSANPLKCPKWHLPEWNTEWNTPHFKVKKSPQNTLKMWNLQSTPPWIFFEKNSKKFQSETCSENLGHKTLKNLKTRHKKA